MTTKILIAAANLLLVFGAYAQTDTITGTAGDPLVITANKYAQKQSTTGKVITVITREQLNKAGGKTVAQVLNEQAGLTINGALNNTGSVQTVYMRGAGSGRTLILLDGIPVNDPSTINNEFDLNLFSIDNIDRIEVCKGAQSTLYGSDAVAGVINIITVDNNANKPFNIKGSLVGGSYGTLKGSAQVYGKTGKFSYSARYGGLRTDGFSAAYDSTGSMGFDNDGYNGNVVNAQVNYQAAQYLLLKSFMMYSGYKADIDAGVFVDEKDYTINNDNVNTGAGFIFKKDFVTLTGNYQYSQLNRRYANDSGFKTSTIFERNNYFAKTQFAELYAAINLGSGFTLLQGADFRYSSYNQQYSSVSSFGPYDDSFDDTSLSQSGLYASLNYVSKNQQFAFEIGGRLNTHSRYGNNSTYTFNPSYAVTKKLRLFGSASSGFKAPTLYQLSLNRQLAPEKSVNYEGGVQLNCNTLSTRLVYFNRNINNGIDYNYITFNYFNYIKQRVQGLEYEATYTPVKKLTITANYTLLIPKETTQNRTTNQDTVTYNYLLRRPKNSANLIIDLQVTPKWNVSVNGRYVDGRLDVGGYARKDVQLESYFIVGMYTGYRLNNHLSFFADGQNLGNKQFFDVRGYNSIPAILNAGVRANW